MTLRRSACREASKPAPTPLMSGFSGTATSAGRRSNLECTSTMGSILLATSLCSAASATSPTTMAFLPTGIKSFLIERRYEGFSLPEKKAPMDIIRVVGRLI